MQNVSSAFHAAVLAGAPQSAYLRFSDDIFTNEDIDISGGGIRWNQPFCTETDLKIGAAVSASIHCELLNENRVLRDYSFGEAEAWLGVRISATPQAEFSGLSMSGPNGFSKAITLGTSPNYILADGTALGSQPDFEPVSLVGDRKILYAIAADGDVWAYDFGENEEVQLDLTPHMEAKALGFANRGLFVTCAEFDEYALTDVWSAKNGVKQTFEYCRLGIFIAERPAKLQDATVSMDGTDRMKLFEEWLGSDLTIPQNGITFGDMLAAMCTAVGVPLATTTFPNSTLIYKKPSDRFKTSTFREIVGYIAEAAGRIARITRDGKLELAWLNTTTLRVTPDKYSEAAVYSYQVQSIDKTAIYSDDGEVTESSE